MLNKQIVGHRNRKGVPNKPGSIQEHHIIPDAVRADASNAGIKIDDFTIGMDYENHVGSRVGLHHLIDKDPVTGLPSKGEFEKIYNKVWKDFFTDDDGNKIARSPKEILDFAQKIVNRYGMDGM